MGGRRRQWREKRRRSRDERRGLERRGELRSAEPSAEHVSQAVAAGPRHPRARSSTAPMRRAASRHNRVSPPCYALAASFAPELIAGQSQCACCAATRVVTVANRFSPRPLLQEPLEPLAKRHFSSYKKRPWREAVRAPSATNFRVGVILLVHKRQKRQLRRNSASVASPATLSSFGSEASREIVTVTALSASCPRNSLGAKERTTIKSQA